MIKTNRKEIAYILLFITFILLPIINYKLFLLFMIPIVLLGGWFEILVFAVFLNAFTFNSSNLLTDQYILIVPTLITILSYYTLKRYIV